MQNHHLTTTLLAGIAGACVSIPQTAASPSAQAAIDYAAMQAHASTAARSTGQGAPARSTGQGAPARATLVQGSAWRGDGVTPKETRQMKRLAARIQARKATT